MAIFKSLKKIITQNPKTHLQKLTITPKKTLNFSLLSRNPSLSHSPLLYDPSFHQCGPLFLSSHHPWMLSLFATPLLVRSDVVLVPPRFDLGLGLGLGFVKPVVDGGRRGEKGDEGKVVVVGGGGGGVGFVESFVNLPNFVSFSRLLSGPLLGWMILKGWYLPAFAGLAISGATDWLDGYLARRMGINSVVGSYLDPLADKVLVGSVALAMVEKGLLHPGLVGLVVFRDVMLVGGAVYKRGSSLRWQWKSWYDFFNLDGTRPEKVEPLFISKVNTVFQLALVAGALLQPEYGTPETQAYITYLSWLVASTTVGSTAAYGVQYMRNKSLSIASGR